MDMSLDQIIKLQNKKKKQSTTRSQQSARGRGKGARGGGARRGGGLKKVGVVTGLRNRRLGVGAKAVVNGGGARQRLAQNLVKRAMLQRRRQAISQRKAVNAASASGQANTQRLLQEMRHWRQTAQVLQSALQQQVAVSPKKIRLRRNNFQQPDFQQVQTRTSLQNRLGWRGRPNRRGGVNQRVIVRKTIQQPRNSSGTFGQMQSDVLSREQARQQRLADEIMNQTLQTIGGVRTRGRGRARGRRQILPETNVQLARNNISRRFGGQSFAGAQLRQVGGLTRGRGRGSQRGAVGRQTARDSVNTFRSSFVSVNQGGTTLNERFGGGGGAGVGVNSFVGRGRGGRRGRGRRYNY
jgi:hypothetical protein